MVVLGRLGGREGGEGRRGEGRGGEGKGGGRGGEGRGGEERGGDEGGGEGSEEGRGREGSLHTVSHTHKGVHQHHHSARVVSVNHEDLNTDIHTVELHEAHLPLTSPDLP